MVSRQKKTRRKSPLGGNGALHAWALQHCRRTYRRGNWAGKGTLPAIKDVTAEMGHWRPQSDQHTIAEIALHMAYWKDAVTAQITGSNWKYSDADNWRAAPPGIGGWTSAQAELDAAQRRLVEAIRSTSPARLMERARGPWRLFDVIVDIATHDSYHSAQIFILRRLYVGRDSQA